MYTLYIHVHVSYSNQEPDNVCRESIISRAPGVLSKAQSLPYIIGGLATGPHFAFWLNSQKDERVQTGEIAHLLI